MSPQARESRLATLHLTNGDSAAGTLRTFIADPVIVTADVLHEGPAPATTADGWHRVRARFLAADDGHDAEAIRRDLAALDERLTHASAFEELVLWFEHDLFDQLLLIRTLDLLHGSAQPDTGDARGTAHAVSGTPHAAPRVSLICIGDFPGVERFIGLGQLRADQLATLVDRRQPVVAEQYAAASAAWRAFRDPDPSALVALSRRPVDALPFLRDALLRFLAEYPSTTNGLGHTEQLILDTLDEGPLTGIALFSRAQRREPRPFMGDGCFLDRIRRMADARVPLVTIEPGGDGVDLRTRTIATTAAGRDVCHSRQDAVRLNGIDTWRGGVRLRGAEAPWRWDPAAETLVSWVPPRGHDAAAEQ